MKVIITIAPPKMDKKTRNLHYRIINRDELSEKQKQWSINYREKNLEKCKESARQWRVKNAEYLKEYKKQYYLKNRHPDTKNRPRFKDNVKKIKNIVISRNNSPELS